MISFRSSSTMRRAEWVGLVVGLLLAMASMAHAEAAPAKKIIYVQLLAPAPATGVVNAVADGLRAFYPVEVKVLPAVDMPKDAWHAPRKRWDADRLLPWLAARLPADGQKILGLTRDDIFTHDAKRGLWGVLGLGSLDGKSNVISSFRAQRGVNAEGLRARIAKVAVHEVGHNFGLGHCEHDRRCLMADANGKVSTVDGENDLCKVCRKKLNDAGVSVPTAPQTPWRNP